MFALLPLLEADRPFRLEGDLRFAFGKYRGQPFDFVAQSDPGYLAWMLDGNFLEDAKAIAREALDARSAPGKNPRLGPAGL